MILINWKKLSQQPAAAIFSHSFKSSNLLQNEIFLSFAVKSEKKDPIKY